MNISKKILRAINEGVLNALSFDDELPDTEDVTMHKVSNNVAANELNKVHERQYYSLMLQDMLPDPLSIKKDFIKFALELHEKYGATYNPHLDKIDFKGFIKMIMRKINPDESLNWIDTSEVTDMTEAFFDTKFDGDISEWNTSNVKIMKSMFESSNFKNDSICNWDVSNVIDMDGMFEYSQFNKSLANWDVSNVIDMNRMFKESIFNLPLDSWNTSSLKFAGWMFSGNNFFLLDISMWDTSSMLRPQTFAYLIFDKNSPMVQYHPEFIPKKIYEECIKKIYNVF